MDSQLGISLGVKLYTVTILGVTNCISLQQEHTESGQNREVASLFRRPLKQVPLHSKFNENLLLLPKVISVLLMIDVFGTYTVALTKTRTTYQILNDARYL